MVRGSATLLNIIINATQILDYICPDRSWFAVEPHTSGFILLHELLQQSLPFNLDCKVEDILTLINTEMTPPSSSSSLNVLQSCRTPQYFRRDLMTAQLAGAHICTTALDQSATVHGRQAWMINWYKLVYYYIK